MIRKFTGTFGVVENPGTKRERFRTLPDGEDVQIYVEFDNGSVIGTCDMAHIGEFIRKSITDLDEMPDRANY